ncbi:MAG: flippase-like domain-containing protein [Spirosomaceae bacterium]|nr:flippase-like domain-containing protein [Spirosomataceae bacterium]
MKKVLQYLISLTIAGGLLWFVFKDVDIDALFATFSKADYRWVALSGALALVAHWSRAYRWKLMLQPIGYNPSAYKTMLAVLIGYVVNLVLPRAGELARCGSLQKLEGVPFEKSFGAVVAERLVDVLILLLLIGLNLLLEFDRISGFFFELIGDKFDNTALLAGIAFAGISLILLAVFLFRKYKSKIEQLAFYQKVSSVVSGLWSGFTSIRNLKNPAAFIGHTVLIWVMYYSMTYALCFALPETASLSPLAGLTILVMGTIGMAAPTIGGIGSYHFLVGKIVALYGINAQIGITLATFLHSMMGVLFVLIFGLIAFILTFTVQKTDSKTP